MWKVLQTHLGTYFLKAPGITEYSFTDMKAYGQGGSPAAASKWRQWDRGGWIEGWVEHFSLGLTVASPLTVYGTKQVPFYSGC